MVVATDMERGSCDLFASKRSSCELEKLEKLIVELEQLAPMISSQIVDQLRNCQANLTSLVTEEDKLFAWKLSYRAWNTCVAIANDMHNVKELGEDHARLRQIASDLLLQAGCVGNIRSSYQKMATFFLKTGVIWYKVQNFSMASICLEKATELNSKGRDEGDGDSISQNKEDKQFLFDLCMARAKTAWELSHKTLACSLLSRARGLLSSLPEKQLELAEQFLYFGKELILKEEDAQSQSDSLRYMEQAFEICSGSLNGKPDVPESGPLADLRLKILRYLAAGHLQSGNFESVLKCVGVLKLAQDHPSTAYLALRALAKLGRYEESEKELIALIRHTGASLEACISGIKIVVQDSSSLNAGMRAFFALQSRYPSNTVLPVFILEILLRKASAPDNNSKKRVEAALQVACNEKVLSTVKDASNRGFALQCGNDSSGKERECIHVLLWNSGSEHFHAKDYETSVRLFEASMLYLPLGADSYVQRAKSLRVLCVCHLGLMQYDRAAEYVCEAEKLDPNIACAFLKFKICLQTNDEEGATKQVQMMTTCPNFEPDYLTLAAHEAITCKRTKVAITALSNMLDLHSEKCVIGTKEVVLLRNIVNLALQDVGNAGEGLKYCNRAKVRLAESGLESFCGSGNIGQREANWFASTCWNEGLRAVKAHEWKICAEFFACSVEFFSVLPESSEVLSNLATALLFTLSALLATDPTDDDSLKAATTYLDRCRKVHGLSAATPHPQNSDECTFLIHLNLLAFDLKGRTKDHKGQLEIMGHCGSLPGFKSEHFLKMALHAEKEQGHNIEVASTAYELSLSRMLTSPTPDYKTVTTVWRKLILLGDLQEKDSPKVMAVYKQAKEILLDLKPEEYPHDEVQWLVATSWNRAALHVKFLRYKEAEQWMSVALDLAKFVPTMENQISLMMESLSTVLRAKASSPADVSLTLGT